MKTRKPLSKNKSKRLFSKTADKTKGINVVKSPMRGGYRL